MKKLLLIVDAQYDFINGSLAVEGAEEKMNALAEYVKGLKPGEYQQIIMTADFHPYDHCSFSQWPVHCVQHSHGASIWQPLFDAVHSLMSDALVFTKGDNSESEEYSILANPRNGKRLLDIISIAGIDEIHICGLCGDFCVGNTIKDLVAAGHGSKIVALEKFIGHIDDGTVFRTIVADNNLRVI